MTSYVIYLSLLTSHDNFKVAAIGLISSFLMVEYIPLYINTTSSFTC